MKNKDNNKRFTLALIGSLSLIFSLPVFSFTYPANTTNYPTSTSTIYNAEFVTGTVGSNVTVPGGDITGNMDTATLPGGNIQSGTTVPQANLPANGYVLTQSSAPEYAGMYSVAPSSTFVIATPLCAPHFRACVVLTPAMTDRINSFCNMSSISLLSTIAESADGSGYTITVAANDWIEGSCSDMGIAFKAVINCIPTSEKLIYPSAILPTPMWGTADGAIDSSASSCTPNQDYTGYY